MIKYQKNSNNNDKEDVENLNLFGWFRGNKRGRRKNQRDAIRDMKNRDNKLIKKDKNMNY